MKIKIKEDVLITGVEVEGGRELAISFRVVFTKPTDSVATFLGMLRDMKPAKVKLSFDTLDCEKE